MGGQEGRLTASSVQEGLAVLSFILLDLLQPNLASQLTFAFILGRIYKLK